MDALQVLADAPDFQVLYDARTSTLLWRSLDIVWTQRYVPLPDAQAIAAEALATGGRNVCRPGFKSADVRFMARKLARVAER